MKIPKQKSPKLVKYVKNAFFGLNSKRLDKKVGRFSGSFDDSSNIDFKQSRAKSRARRKLQSENILAFGEKDGKIIEVMANKFRYDSVETAMPIELDEGEKRLLLTENYAILYPDKIKYSFADKRASRLDKKATKTVKLTLTDDRYLDIALATAVAAPAGSYFIGSDLFEQTIAEGDKLFKYQNRNYIEIENPKTRISFEGENEFKKGDMLVLKINGETLIKSEVEYSDSDKIVLKDRIKNYYNGEAELSIELPTTQIEVFYKGRIFASSDAENAVYISGKDNKENFFGEGSAKLELDSFGEFSGGVIFDKNPMFLKEDTLIRINELRDGFSSDEESFFGISNSKKGEVATTIDNMYLARNDGIYLYNGATEKKINLPSEVDTSGSLKLFTYENDLYFDTGNRLYKYDKDEESFSKFDKLCAKEAKNVLGDVLYLDAQNNLKSLFGKNGIGFCEEKVEFNTRTKIVIPKGKRLYKIEASACSNGEGELEICAESGNMILADKKAIIVGDDKISAKVKGVQIEDFTLEIIGKGEIILNSLELYYTEENQ